RAIEAAIGRTPCSVTIEGRNRFTINVRYPQDLRSDIDRLKRVLVPVGESAPGGEGMRGTLLHAKPMLLAQNMGEMQGGASRPGTAPERPRLPGAGVPPQPAMTDTGMNMGALPMPREAMPGQGMPPPPAPAGSDRSGRRFVPLGQLADIRIAGGPPMVRDEGGFLVGYVYVDIDQTQRDIGGYVNDAK